MKFIVMEFCKGTTSLHVPAIRLESAEVLIEFCTHCKEEVIFKKSKEGRIDNETYRIFHKRDMLQPGDNHYEKEYKKV